MYKYSIGYTWIEASIHRIESIHVFIDRLLIETTYNEHIY